MLLDSLIPELVFRKFKENENMSKNWIDDEIEVQEGSGAFDEDTEYLWEISTIEKSINVVISRDAPAYAKGKPLESLSANQIRELAHDGINENNGTTNYLNVTFLCVDNGKPMKESFSIKNPKVNEKDPKWEAQIFTFIRNLGNTVSAGMKIRISDYIKPGTRFYAHVMPQIRNHEKTGFHQIDLMSVRPCTDARATEGKSSSSAAPVASPEIISEIKEIVKGAKTSEEAIQKLIGAGKSTLVGIFFDLAAKGEIKLG
jgi:hypothetical protein